jgi:hypothetical protein
MPARKFALMICAVAGVAFYYPFLHFLDANGLLLRNAPGLGRLGLMLLFWSTGNASIGYALSPQSADKNVFGALVLGVLSVMLGFAFCSTLL